MRRAWLLPVVFVTYSLAYLDRANFGFGAAAGLAQTLHIDGQRTALLSAFFFLGYFLFQIPGMRLAERFSCTRLVFGSLLMWGVLASLTGILRSFVWLCVDRMLLGVAESIVFPALLLLLTHWFTRSERSRANSILLLGNPLTVLWMSALTGVLIDRLGWQRTFVIEGAPAIVWAMVWIAVVRDRPTQARWVARDDAEPVERLVAAEAAAGRPGDSVASLLLQRGPLLLAAQYFFWSLGVYGFVLWLPTIVRQGTAISMGRTGLLSAVPYVLAIAGLLLVGHLSDRTLRRRSFVWPCLLIAGAAMMASFALAPSSFAAAFVCLALSCGAMYAPYPAFFAMIPECVPREAAGSVFAMVNSAGALGGFVGSYVVGVLNALTHRQSAGDLLMSLAFFAAAALTFTLPRDGAANRRGVAHA